MTFGAFEMLESSESEYRVAANAAARELDTVIVAVKTRHAAYLNGATSQKNFFERLGNVKGDMRRVVQAHGIEPRHSIMNKVINACKADARPHWQQRQAAEGTSVAEAAPATDLATPVSTLSDSPIGAVASRRTANAENGTSDDFHDYGHRPDPEETERNNRGYSDVGNGMVQDWETGEIHPNPGHVATRRVGGGFSDFLQQGVRGLAEGLEPPASGGGPFGDFARGLDSGIESQLPPEISKPRAPKLPKGHGGHGAGQEFMEGIQQGVGNGLPRGASRFDRLLLATENGGFNGSLIPEGDFDAYLNRVTGPETDRASEHPFGARDGEHDWENTGKTGAFDRLLNGGVLDEMRAAHPDLYGPGAPAADADFNFTGSPETQYHHRAGPWSKENDYDIDAMYQRQHEGQPVHARRQAAALYYAWCHRNRLANTDRRNVMAFGQRAPVSAYNALLSGIREAYAQQEYRTAAGKDHLQTSQDSITKMLNELAEEFQKSIVPLQDALQSVQFAQQSMASQQSAMDVMPPGSINVMPGGQAPPGAPPMDGQNMAAAPTPDGMSPMVDPNAAGGMPADPAAAGGGAPVPGGPPAPGGGGGLPPEVAQILQQIPPEALMEFAVSEITGGGGGAPAAGAPAPAAPMEAPMDPAAGGGAPPAPAQRPVANVRRYAEFPFAKGGDDGPPKDDDEDKPDKKDSSDGPPPPEKDKDSPPKKDGPPSHDDGPPVPPQDGADDAGSDADLKDDLVSAILQLLDVGDIDTAQAVASQFGVTDDDINAFLSDDDYDSGDPFAAAGGPPPPDAGPPPGPPGSDGPPLPPPPPGVPHPDAGPPPELKEAQRRAMTFLRWAATYNLPVDEHSAELFRQAEFQQDFARDIADGHPDTPQQARFVNYLTRWHDMRDNAAGKYSPNQFVSDREGFGPLQGSRHPFARAGRSLAGR